MNMSYCRFENTANNLRDCIEALHDDEMPSMTEYYAMQRMIEMCTEFIQIAEVMQDMVEGGHFKPGDEEDE